MYVRPRVQGENQVIVSCGMYIELNCLYLGMTSGGRRRRGLIRNVRSVVYKSCLPIRAPNCSLSSVHFCLMHEYFFFRLLHDIFMVLTLSASKCCGCLVCHFILALPPCASLSLTPTWAAAVVRGARRGGDQPGER